MLFPYCLLPIAYCLLPSLDLHPQHRQAVARLDQAGEVAADEHAVHPGAVGPRRLAGAVDRPNAGELIAAPDLLAEVEARYSWDRTIASFERLYVEQLGVHASVRPSATELMAS